MMINPGGCSLQAIKHRSQIDLGNVTVKNKSCIFMAPAIDIGGAVKAEICAENGTL
jgi:hypothetical protein